MLFLIILFLLVFPVVGMNKGDNSTTVDILGENDCLVCFEPYDTSEKKRIDLLCNPNHRDKNFVGKKIYHSFCEGCLKNVMKLSSRCPLCQEEIKLPPYDVQKNVKKMKIKRSYCTKICGLFTCFN